jgi:hypothetical protein
VAAMIGSTAFLAPLIATSPRRGVPPLINKLSMSVFEVAALHRLVRYQKSRALSVVFDNGLYNPLFAFKQRL